MADSVDRVFVHALSTVKKLPKTGAARPPAADRMRLYGLYKQAMEGDVDGVMDRPNAYSGLSVDEIRREQDKWDSWNAQRGLGRTEAKRRYIETLIDTMHTYAVTQPATELVAELEFVWTQIKDNHHGNSGASTSPKLSDRDAFGLGAAGGGVPGVPSPRPDEYYDAYDKPALGTRKKGDSRRMSATASDGGPMKVLSPMSEEDEAERENRMRMIEEELAAEEAVGESGRDDDHGRDDEYARRISHAPFTHDASHDHKDSGKDSRRSSGRLLLPPDDKDAGAGPASPRWSRMMERALVKLSAEVAALREQILAAREFRSRQEEAQRTGIAAWVQRAGWLGWLLLRHVVVDTVLLGVVLLWLRRRKDRRLEDHVRGALAVLREYVRALLPSR